MKITGFAAQNLSADNHGGALDAATISEGVDLVVAELDAQANSESWVDMVKASPYYITRQNA